jgi:transcriptional regulator with XRE-family HTH domain
MEVRRRLGVNVRRERQRLGISQEELAFDSGVHRTYISGVERGVRNPTVTVVERLASALRVPASALLADGHPLQRRASASS